MFEENFFFYWTNVFTQLKMCLALRIAVPLSHNYSESTKSSELVLTWLLGLWHTEAFGYFDFRLPVRRFAFSSYLTQGEGIIKWIQKHKKFLLYLNIDTLKVSCSIKETHLKISYYKIAHWLCILVVRIYIMDTIQHVPIIDYNL